MSVYVLVAGTIAGLRDEIKMSTKALIEAKTSTVSVSSGCELFVRFITLTSKLEEKVRAKTVIDCTYTCDLDGMIIILLYQNMIIGKTSEIGLFSSMCEWCVCEADCFLTIEFSTCTSYVSCVCVKEILEVIQTPYII